MQFDPRVESGPRGAEATSEPCGAKAAGDAEEDAGGGWEDPVEDLCETNALLVRGGKVFPYINHVTVEIVLFSDYFIKDSEFEKQRI